MQVIGVGRVVIRREHRSEYPAGMIAYLVQEFGVAASTVPAPKHADTPTVRKHERGYIQRIATGMFAPPTVRAAIHPAAAIGPEMLDTGHFLPENRFGRRLNPLPQP